MPATTPWECIPINPTLLKLEFVGASPSPEEIAALQVALHRFFAQHNGLEHLNAWRVAERFPDATPEDLRLQQIAAWDVL